MKITTTLFAMALVAAAPSVFAQSADLEITGKILPGACAIELGGGGIADLGSISVNDLDPDKETSLPPVTLPLSVACESPTRFALQGTDNAADSMKYYNYGLGMTQADEKIGGAYIFIADAFADASAAYMTRSRDGGESWSDSNLGAAIVPGYINGFTAERNVATGPAPIKTLQGGLRVGAKISPTSELTIDREVPITGSATIELIYL